MGRGISLPAVDGTYDTAIEEGEVTVSVAGLTLGWHTLYIRFRDTEGQWGIARSYRLFVTATPLQGAEAFIDRDPGKGKGFPMQAEDGSFDEPEEAVTLTQNISGLAPGIHTLFLRGQRTDGTWGKPQSLRFTVSDAGNSVLRAEYFIGRDPGAGKGTPLPIGQNTTISTAGLSVGKHRLGVRLQDATGQWSGARYVPLTITACRCPSGSGDDHSPTGKRYQSPRHNQ